jgi:prepilin-type N-terminal cleavage/methylation domain-containing protein
VKLEKTGMTLVELLVVLGIIALLVGILIPALSLVQRTARETKQQAQFSAIDLALTGYKNDFGDYPPSELTSDTAGSYCGAQKLTEAVFGWDLSGFHPDTAWRADGLDATGGADSYDPAQTRDINNDGVPDTFDERKEPYLELASDNVFKLGNTPTRQGLYQNTDALAPNTYVICDVFGKQKIKLLNGKTAMAGSPVLYYRANISEKTIIGIYNHLDNYELVRIKEMADNRGTGRHPLIQPVPGNNYQYFYDYIIDPKIEARAWPYKPDSYILISAGADGLYGTRDDIRNFGN